MKKDLYTIYDWENPPHIVGGVGIDDNLQAFGDTIYSVIRMLSLVKDESHYTIFYKQKIKDNALKLFGMRKRILDQMDQGFMEEKIGDFLIQHYLKNEWEICKLYLEKYHPQIALNDIPSIFEEDIILRNSKLETIAFFTNLTVN